MRIVLAGLLAATPYIAVAQETPRDAHAATSLRHHLRNDPDDRAVMANLAREYLKAGRTAKAQRLYRQLLDMDDVALERAGRTPVSSHWLAAQALRQSSEKRAVRMSARQN